MLMAIWNILQNPNIKYYSLRSSVKWKGHNVQFAPLLEGVTLMRYQLVRWRAVGLGVNWV